MGPHSFKCGKRTPAKPPTTQEKGFNGAALFQVRKAGKTGLYNND